MSPVLLERTDYSKQATRIPNGSKDGATRPVTSSVEAEEIYKNPLDHEIDYFRKNWRKEGLPYNWDELPGTGFQNETQIKLIFSDIKKTDGEDQRREKMKKALVRTETDIKGFILEYLAEGLVFPIHYKIQLVNGRKRLVDPLYDKLVVDTVSAEERNGSVKRALEEKVEPALISQPDNSVWIMTSPDGWTGMRGTDGELINYPDSQTHIWQKKGDDVFGFTVRTDFKKNEHREMLKRLSFGGTDLEKDASVCDYVESIVGVIPIEERFGIREVVKVMEKTRHDLTGSNLAYKNRGWDEVYKDLDRREELWQFNKQTGKMVEEFEDYVLSSRRSRKEVKQALAVTILKIAKFLRGEKLIKVKESNGMGENDLDYDSTVSYGMVLDHVSELPGCAGGGGKKLTDSITPRHTETLDSSEKTLECECPFCHQKVKAVIKDGRIHCPNCENSAEYKC